MNKAGTYSAHYYNTRHKILVRPDFIRNQTTTQSPYPRYKALSVAKAEKEVAKVGASLQSYTPPALCRRLHPARPQPLLAVPMRPS